jgi:hypothetical protein
MLKVIFREEAGRTGNTLVITAFEPGSDEAERFKRRTGNKK